jgi:hypothetical protein
MRLVGGCHIDRTGYELHGRELSVYATQHGQRGDSYMGGRALIKKGRAGGAVVQECGLHPDGSVFASGPGCLHEGCTVMHKPIGCNRYLQVHARRTDLHLARESSSHCLLSNLSNSRSMHADSIRKPGVLGFWQRWYGSPAGGGLDTLQVESVAWLECHGASFRLDQKELRRRDIREVHSQALQGCRLEGRVAPVGCSQLQARFQDGGRQVERMVTRVFFY